VGRRRKVPGRHTRPDAHPVRRATPRRGLQSSPGENLLGLSDAGTAACRRARDVRRSARRIIRRIEPGAELIAALFLSLGLWGVVWGVISALTSGLAVVAVHTGPAP
jgi:hypothetical protein